MMFSIIILLISDSSIKWIPDGDNCKNIFDLPTRMLEMIAKVNPDGGELAKKLIT